MFLGFDISSECLVIFFGLFPYDWLLSFNFPVFLELSKAVYMKKLKIDYTIEPIINASLNIEIFRGDSSIDAKIIYLFIFELKEYMSSVEIYKQNGSTLHPGIATWATWPRNSHVVEWCEARITTTTVPTTLLIGDLGTCLRHKQNYWQKY